MIEKKTQLHTRKKNFILIPYIHFNTLRSILPIRLKICQSQQNFHVTSKKANCKYVAAKRKFQNNFQNSRTLRSQHIVILGGSCQSMPRAQAQAHTLAATCLCMQTRASQYRDIARAN